MDEVDDWDDDAGVDLNLTSLVDVVFALLIVFMVSSAAMIEEGRNESASGQIDLALPTGNTKASKAPAGELVVQVDADGSLYVGAAPTDRKSLSNDIIERLAKTPDLQVRIEADSKLAYQRVMDVIAHLHDIGVRNVGLATRAKGAP